MSVGARVYPWVHMYIHVHVHAYTHIHKRRRLSFLPGPKKTFSKTFTKTLDKMADLCYDINVIRDGDNLDDHSCTSCVLEDGDLAIRVPVFLSKSLPQTLDIQNDPWYNTLARVNGDTLV